MTSTPLNAVTDELRILLSRTSVGRGILHIEEEPEPEQQRAVDLTQGHGNTRPLRTDEDNLLDRLIAVTGAVDPRSGRWL